MQDTVQQSIRKENIQGTCSFDILIDKRVEESGYRDISPDSTRQVKYSSFS